jgi:hypothetical protein
MKVLLYKMADGVAVGHLSWDFVRQLMAEKGMTEDEAIAFIEAKDKPDGCISCRVIDDSELPAENANRGSGATTFRDAWIDTGVAVDTDMPKARAIHLEEIRRVRNAELVKEDVTFMRAVEAEDTDAQATIKTKKQTLRDIPATFDITTDVDTPEKLKAKWPTELPARE